MIQAMKAVTSTGGLGSWIEEEIAMRPKPLDSCSDEMLRLSESTPSLDTPSAR